MDASAIVCHGYFTTLGFIENLSGSDLERCLGYATDRLKPGFMIVKLADDELLSADDFELKASTRWSDGKVGAKANVSAGVEIEGILAAQGLDVGSLKRKVAAFFAKRGPNTPARVIPAVEHVPGMEYPGGEALGGGKPGGFPQFYLPRTKARRFVIFRNG